MTDFFYDGLFIFQQFCTYSKVMTYIFKGVCVCVNVYVCMYVSMYICV